MTIKQWCEEIGSWRRGKGFMTEWTNMPEKLMLVVTELAEAMEALRQPDRGNFPEEIADAVIRLFDICDAVHIDLEDEIASKMEKNARRPFRHGKVM